MSRRPQIEDFFTDVVEIYTSITTGYPPVVVEVLVFETMGSYQYNSRIPAADLSTDQYRYELFLPILDGFDIAFDYKYVINGVDIEESYIAERKEVFDENGTPYGIKVLFESSSAQPA